jgi:hypothetical protein
MVPFDGFRKSHQQIRGGLVEGRPLGIHDAQLRFNGAADPVLWSAEPAHQNDSNRNHHG